MFILIQVAAPRGPESLPSRRQKTLATPSSNSMAMIGKVERSRSVKIATLVLLVVLVVAVALVEVVLVVVEASVVGEVDLEAVVATVAEVDLAVDLVAEEEE